MTDTTKPAAQAVAKPHKAPSKASIDTAQDELANLQYKLGRAQVAAMLSAGQAKADKAALGELEILVEAKRQAVETMVETFTNPHRPEPAEALQAIREKLGNVDQANGPGMPGDPVVAASKIHDGGMVKPGASYLVGEFRPSAIAPAKPLTAADLDEIKGKGEGEVATIKISHTITADQARRLHDAIHKPHNVEDPESLNWGNPVKAVVVETIENAQPGDVEIPDLEDPADMSPRLCDGVRMDASKVDMALDLDADAAATAAKSIQTATEGRNAFRGKRPPKDPSPGDVWIYPTAAGGPTVEYDASMGWVIVADKGEITEHTRKAVAADFTSDFWEAGEIDAALNHPPRHKRGLFERG